MSYLNDIVAADYVDDAGDVPQLAPPASKLWHKNYKKFQRQLRAGLRDRLTFSASPLAVLPYDTPARRRAKVVLPEYCALRKAVGWVQKKAWKKMLPMGKSYPLTALDFVADVDVAARAAMKTQPQLLEDFMLVFGQEETSGDLVADYASLSARHFGTMLELLGQELRTRNITSLRAYCKVGQS